MLQKSLPVYEIPRRFIRCESIPRTLNGKISKEIVQIITEIHKDGVNI